MTQYEADAFGAAYRHVVCKSCAHTFTYVLMREETGDAERTLMLDAEGGRQTAADRAQRALARRLERDHDVVPCPQCGLVQDYMVVAAKKNKHELLSYLAIASGVCAAVCFVGASAGAAVAAQTRKVLWVGTACAAISTVIVIVLQKVLRARYDPNRRPLSDRLSDGRFRTFSEGDEEGQSRVIDHVNAAALQHSVRSFRYKIVIPLVPSIGLFSLGVYFVSLHLRKPTLWLLAVASVLLFLGGTHSVQYVRALIRSRRLIEETFEPPEILEDSQRRRTAE